MSYNVVVIGAGPAGLAAARELGATGVCLIDAGPCYAVRRHEFDGTIAGSGGASLCNDGKLSFGTAGTALKWLPQHWCNDAKKLLLSLLGRDPIEPRLADGCSGDPTPACTNCTFELKRYPTVKTSVEERLDLISRLEGDITRFPENACMWDTRVTGVHWIPERNAYVVETVNSDGNLVRVTASAIINAGGRMGPLALPAPSTTFRRLSFGVRVVMAVGATGVGDAAVLNPTKVWNTTCYGVPVQYRTFCWCNNGRVVLADLSTLGLDGCGMLSGTTDPAPEGSSDLTTVVTGSNVGIMARLLSPPTPRLERAFDRWMQLATFSCGVGPTDVISSVSDDDVDSLLVQPIATLVQQGVNEFISTHPQLRAVSLHGPCVEGVGHYPATNPGTQRIEGDDFAGPAYFAAGDGAGHLRGLVPSFASGFCAGRQAKIRLATLRAVAKARALGHAAGLAAAEPPKRRVGCEPVPTPFAGPDGNLMMFEVHIFVAPLNPDPATRSLYNSVVDVFNGELADAYGETWKAMKTPFLGLRFQGAGYVHVMQSARYVLGTDAEAVTRAAYEEDAAVLSAAGLQVVRVKVELSMHGAERIDPAVALPSSIYTEHHVRVTYAHADQEASPEPSELEQLEDVALKLTRVMGVPVALSYNLQRHESSDTMPGRKRFLNIRFRGYASAGEALARVEELKRIVRDEAPAWTVGIPINEWVMSDSNVDMDRGWIDMPKNRVIAVSGHRFTGKSALEQALVAAARSMGVALRVVRMADDTKRQFIASAGLPSDCLENRAMKEKLRPQLSKFAEDAMRTDPARFFAPVQDAVRQTTNVVEVVLVPDLRLRAQASALAAAVDPSCLITVRIEASPEARSARGFVPSANDTSLFETDLDDKTDWTTVFQNDGDDLAALALFAKHLLVKCCCV